MKTECTPEQIEFHGLGRRDVIGKFDGGNISSDGGGILLREVEKRTGIARRLSECFRDFRDPELIEHTGESLIKQRVFAAALGYEDQPFKGANNHDVRPASSLAVDTCGVFGSLIRSGAGFFGPRGCF